MKTNNSFHIRELLWYMSALVDEPKGIICGWCKKPNDFFDDCGWFRINPHGNDSRIACESCFRGPLGQKHVARYGLGDR